MACRPFLLSKSILQPCIPHLASKFSTSSPSFLSSKLVNKKILITGASRGIGKAIAYSFAAHGGQCVLVGRKKEGLEDVLKELSTEGLSAGACHEVLVGDVAKMEFWEGARKVSFVLFIFVSFCGVFWMV